MASLLVSLFPLLPIYGFPLSSVGKESACNPGDTGSIPGSGRSPGEGNGNPLQYSCLENPMSRGAWQATVYGFTRVGHNLVTNTTTTTTCNRAARKMLRMSDHTIPLLRTILEPCPYLIPNHNKKMFSRHLGKD